MSLPKKGRRTITVLDKKYHWIVTANMMDGLI